MSTINYTVNPMEELCHAVCYQSEERVAYWANETCDVNANMAPLVPTEFTKFGVKRTEGANAHMTILHVAIVQYFLDRDYAQNGLRNLQKAIKILIKKGADVSSPVKGIELDLPTHGLTSFGDSLTPGNLLLWLERICDENMTKLERDCINDVFHLLQQASHVERTRASFFPAGTKVPQAVLDTWKGYLFSEKSADMLFVCKPDGEEIVAHSELLSIASPLYFEPLFQGKWGEVAVVQEGRRRFDTPTSSTILKAVLKFVYTGEIESTIVNDWDKLKELFVVSHLYELTSLTRICESHCAPLLCHENAIEMLRLAISYGTNRLFTMCVAFISKNMPQLDDELVSALLGGNDEAPQQEHH